jgi:hypothetical protein
MRTSSVLPRRTASIGCCLAVLLVAGVPGARANAQLIAYYGPHTVEVGERVRVRVHDSIPPLGARLFTPSQRVRGTVTAVSADSLYLDLAGPEGASALAIPRIRIGQVESSLGVSRAMSAWDRGSELAFIGALLFASKLVNRDERFGSDWNAAATGAGVGMLVGGLTGVLWPRERWRPAWLPE